MAYADPPYPGQARRHYEDHPDYAGEVNHAKLIADLERDFPDGWALSTSVPALRDVLNLCPEPSSSLRVAAWVRKPMPWRPARIMWTWEPVIVRTPTWRQRWDSDFVADSLRGYGHRTKSRITGEKPLEFCYWLFDLLGMRPDDEFVDLFPGSGAVGEAWEAWRSQQRLAV